VTTPTTPTKTRPRKAVLVAVVFALAPLAGCLPDNPIWPSGEYVHPQFVTASDAGPCMVGLAWDWTEKIETVHDWYVQDVDNIEFWFSFGNGLANETIDTADCWQVFAHPLQTRIVYWTCNETQFGLTVYDWGQDPDSMRTFRACNDCTTSGDLVYLGPFPCNQGPTPLSATKGES
jgi:hypothetical protein